MLLREGDKQIGLLDRLASCFSGYRNPKGIEHSVPALAAQRCVPISCARVLLSFAYALMRGLRRLGLAGAAYAKAQSTTIRMRLFKIGARIRITARKVWLSYSGASPYAKDIAQFLANFQSHQVFHIPVEIARQMLDRAGEQLQTASPIHNPLCDFLALFGAHRTG